jgi:hypothetical protein
MQMVNLLATMAPAIYDEPITVLRDPLLFGDVPGYYEQVTEDRFIIRGYIIDHGNRLVGNDQNMGRCLGLNIPERGYPVILENNIGWNFPVYDSGE